MSYEMDTNLLTFPNWSKLSDVANPFSTRTPLEHVGSNFGGTFPIYPTSAGVRIRGEGIQSYDFFKNRKWDEWHHVCFLVSGYGVCKGKRTTYIRQAEE
jgi:hypothetical protein